MKEKIINLLQNCCFIPSILFLLGNLIKQDYHAVNTLYVVFSYSNKNGTKLNINSKKYN